MREVEANKNIELNETNEISKEAEIKELKYSQQDLKQMFPCLTSTEKKIFVEKYRDIVMRWIDPEDSVCDICLGGDSYEEDKIIICDLCQSLTHQTCYGSELLSGIPPGKMRENRI